MIPQPAIFNPPVLGPLAAYRSTKEPGTPKPVTPAATVTAPKPIEPVIAPVHVVEFPSGQVPYGTAERAREACDRYNATRGPGVPELFPVVATAVVVARGVGRNGCTVATAEVPRQLWEAFQQRCDTKGVDPSRLLSALVLYHLNKPPEKFASMIPQVDRWEGGKRLIPYADQWKECEVAE